MDFSSLVVSTATILLILVLTLIGISLYRSKHSSDYPPVIGSCPDYWLDNSTEGNGKSCTNVKGLGDSGCSETMDFSTPEYKGKAGLCKKKKWSESCRVTWDGITNNDRICNREFMQ